MRIQEIVAPWAHVASNFEATQRKNSRFLNKCNSNSTRLTVFSYTMWCSCSCRRIRGIMGIRILQVLCLRLRRQLRQWKWIQIQVLLLLDGAGSSWSCLGIKMRLSLWRGMANCWRGGVMGIGRNPLDTYSEFDFEAFWGGVLIEGRHCWIFLRWEPFFPHFLSSLVLSVFGTVNISLCYIGNFIGVRVWAKYPGRVNDAMKGVW